jgi:alkylhydroperoxidase/carboxymuconolactone decarboxylase family protein YurZ
VSTGKEHASVLEKVRKKRGYLLSYHRLLHGISPALLSAYDEFYTQFTLTGRVLTPVQKETVWIALIAATRARVGTIHLRRAVQAGMGKDAIADALAIAAACESLDAHTFSQGAFPEWTDGPRLVAHLRPSMRRALVRRWPKSPRWWRMPDWRDAAGMIHLVRAFARQARAGRRSAVLRLLHCGGPAMVQRWNAG